MPNDSPYRALLPEIVPNTNDSIANNDDHSYYSVLLPKRLDSIPRYSEAGMRPTPKSIPSILYEIALRKIPWDRVRDDIVVPTIEETKKGIEDLKDSANVYMHRSTHPSDKLIDESISDHFRKFGK